MSYLRIAGLKISYGEKVVLHNIDLHVEKGEMIALLGPSGCGKTTLLNALCGFIAVKHGEITVAGRDITHSAPEQRNITMVFQSYALWPHLTVARNIGYGLKLRKWRRDDIDRRVAELLSIVNLTGLADVKVTELSGGQRQRVALARALAIEPDVLVLDEPLSNLDAKVRLNVRHEIKSLQKRLGFTSLIVTHDQQEALVMADRIAVLNNGHIEQIGTPEDIYQRPATPFVADFMGADNKINVNDFFAKENISPSAQGESYADDFRDCTLYFRSADAALCALTDRAPEAGITLNGVVEQSAFLGNLYRHSVRCRERVLLADSTQCWPAQSSVRLHVPAAALHIFPSSQAS
ncbi:ABC-type Fe3+/spermidine/putrescine transport system ATPase subunit [Raoultella sp. BIGb0399]|uniref:ABC transporter ATP-binding protein n=1 Tax=Raoultella lignicola TaxID=3040939 RepID=A0ABU9F919_9ENTR|nr:ABC transporter ATP-binding protein [Raoultella sp. BIGb0399]ROS15301.1 ABC-type Fe3+/spermidine/putrescine transport system ATPase subunit [Raoultella sp. BIGb0399]